MWEFLVPHSNPVILKAKNIFWVFYSLFGISFKFWTFSKKKKIVIANVFPKLATVQGLVTPLTIQRSLKTSFDSQHFKRFQTLIKSSWKHFDQIFSSLWGEIIWKTSPSLRFGIIGFLLTRELPIKVSCSGLWEFVVPYSNPVILKTKNIFPVF